MVIEKFREQIERLRRTFGVNTYPAERVNMFWECFKGFSDSYLEKAVTHFILQRKKAPMHDELLGYLNLLEKKERKPNNIGLRSETHAYCDNKFCGKRFLFVGFLPDLDERVLCPECKGKEVNHE